ncbi:hypothetical protein GGR52DRAFT_544640 [Hypoxylon sp. FL1284]|nr:hypothetical protein GGR52DRAFT_544640 [Hypoxylon sp. FL1284]
MTCGCTRVTIRYACRHKRREYRACWRRELREDNSCVAIFFPKCHYDLVATKITRVCDRCMDYFVVHFGEIAAHSVSEKFIEYKTFMGLHKKVVHPEAVAHECYLTEMFLQMAGATILRGGQPLMNPHEPTEDDAANPEEWWALRKARRARAEGNAALHQHQVLETQTSTAPPRLPEPIVRPTSTKAFMAEQGTRGTRGAGAARPIHVGQSRGEVPFVSIPAMVYQIPKHLQSHGAAALPNMPQINEEVDQAILHGIPLSRTPHQPKPVSTKEARRRPTQKGSDCSLVKRFNKIVDKKPSDETIDIGYNQSVPKLTSAPKVPSWREGASSPNSEASGSEAGYQVTDRGKGKGKEKATSSQSSSPILAALSVALPPGSTPMYVVCDSPPPGEAPVRSSVKPPTRREGGADGVADSMNNWFLEKGLAAPGFLNRSMKVKNSAGSISSSESLCSSSPPPTLVSISTPSPTFSYATQSCFCLPNDADHEVCPACRERRRLERELEIDWL